MVKCDHSKCVGCGICLSACPVDAIVVYGVARITEQCTECLDCIDYCPVDALEGN